jgi:hypothetical protein
MGRAYSPAWLAAAVVASGALILAAPLVGQLSAFVGDAAPGNYALVLGIGVGGAALVAVGLAMFTVRERRRERYAWIALALALAIGYGFVARTGVADVDAAERFHFVEYGVLAVLFYKAWQRSSDGALIVLPVIAGFIVGTLEEWLQWFVPGRVGEAKDVLLNLISVAAGVLFALGVDPPTRVTLRMSPRSRRWVAAGTAVAIAAFAGFFHSVHLGHEIADPGGGVFRSRYSQEELRQISAERAADWKVHPPLSWSRFSREDQYLTEGVAHVRRRNQRWDEGNFLAARQENLILEKYYAPVLDTPSYISPAGHRWPDAQREQAEHIPGPGFMIYESDALDYPVVTWPPSLYWLAVGTAILLTFRRIA